MRFWRIYFVQKDHIESSLEHYKEGFNRNAHAAKHAALQYLKDTQSSVPIYYLRTQDHTPASIRQCAYQYFIDHPLAEAAALCHLLPPGSPDLLPTLRVRHRHL